MVSGGYLEKPGGGANSGNEPELRPPFRVPEPARWPTRPPATEPLLFSSHMRRVDREHERIRQRVQEAAAKDERDNSMKMGAIAIVGIAALIGGFYIVEKSNEPDTVVASCYREDRDGTRTVVADSNCDSSSAGVSYRTRSPTKWPQYRYYYGGTAQIGQAPSGGTTIKPSNAEIKTKSGAVIQRGGLGRGGGGSGS